jgi:hypothetical protein
MIQIVVNRLELAISKCEGNVSSEFSRGLALLEKCSEGKCLSRLAISTPTVQKM